MKILGFFLVLLAVWPLAADTAQDHAFLRVWRIHAANPSNHLGVVDAGLRAMDKSSTLGEWLPVVKTLVAWHLLQGGKTAEAERVFASAVLKTATRHPVYRSADIMSKRWLTRIDAEQVVKALRKYYIDKVEFPEKLDPVMTAGIPAHDRFGNAWEYSLQSFDRIQGLKNQRYRLFSKNTGRETTRLRRALKMPYAYGCACDLLQSKISPPAAKGGLAPPGAQPQELVFGKIDSVAKGWRFVKSSTDGSFVLLADTTGDYWLAVERKK